MDFNSNLPIYIQIMNLIKTKVVSEEIKVGEKMASVRDFSKELKVNPNTIQRVYQELEREELLITKRGMGTFVTENINTITNLKQNTAADLLEQFFIEMKKLGFHSDEIKQMIAKRFEEESE